VADLVLSVSVMNQNGLQLYRQLHPLDDQWSTSCDVGNLPSGLLIVRVNTGLGSRYYKVIKN